MLTNNFNFLSPSPYRVLSRALPGASKSTTILKVALDQGVFIPGMLASFLVLNGALKGMDGHDIKEILNRLVEGQREWIECMDRQDIKDILNRLVEEQRE